MLLKQINIMKSTLSVVLLSLLAIAVVESAVPSIWGFHFHTYYFIKSQKSEAGAFYLKIRNEMQPNGALANCVLSRFSEGPIGPHPIAQFAACCNATALPNAIGFFMKNRGDFPILLHPLTHSEVVDHTDRAMWMGNKIPLDLTYLSPELHHTPICPAANW